MANIRKAFDFISEEETLTHVNDPVGKFVPELSLPINAILQQFAYVDQVRLLDLAKQGYHIGNDDDTDFEVPDFDSMDIAEKQEYYEHCQDIVERYRRQLELQKQEPENTEVPAVDESVLP